MLLYEKELSVGRLQELAAALVAAGKLLPDGAATSVSATIERLTSHYGRNLGVGEISSRNKDRTS